jgi:hypothetical protein
MTRVSGEQVLAALPTARSGGWVTAAEIGRQLGISLWQATDWLRGLHNAGAAVRRREKRGFVFQASAEAVVDVDPAELPELNDGQAVALPPEHARIWIWISTWRRGIDHHAIDEQDPSVTLCGRSTIAGGQLVLDPPAESKPCPRCQATAQARTEWATT